MCNLYRMEDRDWVAKWAIEAEVLINPFPSYELNPDQMGPIVRNAPDGRKQVVHARWGLPSPIFVRTEAAELRASKLRSKGQPVDMDELLRMEPDRGLTNVRKLNLPHRKRWLGVEHRCVVPVTSFAEPDPVSQISGG